MIRRILFYIVSIWFVLSQTFPPINIYFPFNASVAFAIFDAVTILLFPDLLLKRSIVALFIYGIITYLFYISGNAFYGTIATVIVPFIMMLSGLLLLEYTLKYDVKYKFTRIIVFVVIISCLVMTVISIPQVMIMPNIIRPSSLEMVYGEEQNYWIIKYSVCHGLAFLFAPLMFLCRKSFRANKILCLFWTSVSVALFVIVFLSNATTSLLISLVMIVFGLLFKTEKFTRKNIWSFFLVGIISILLTQPSVITPVINSAQRIMDSSSSNYRKMDEIKTAVLYGDADGDLGARTSLYQTSTSLFFESPLFGTDKPNLISYHSWFIDRLACLGIFLFVPIFLLFFFHIKSTYIQFRHTKAVYCIGVFGFLLMLFLKNEFGAGSWLFGFAFLPLLCRYVDYVIDYKTLK